MEKLSEKILEIRKKENVILSGCTIGIDLFIVFALFKGLLSF